MSERIRSFSVGQDITQDLRLTVSIEGSPNVILRLRQIDSGPGHKGLAIDIEGDFPRMYEDLSISVNGRLADTFEEGTT